MEENKNQEKREGQGSKKCSDFNCHGGSWGHKIAKIILVIVAALILLSLGAALGARRTARFYNFNAQPGAGFGCRFQDDWRDGGRQDERRLQMMRGNQNFQNQGNAPAGTQAAGSPALPTGTSTPDTNY